MFIRGPLPLSRHHPEKENLQESERKGFRDLRHKRRLTFPREAPVLSSLSLPLVKERRDVREEDLGSFGPGRLTVLCAPLQETTTVSLLQSTKDGTEQEGTVESEKSAKCGERLKKGSKTDRQTDIKTEERQRATAV